MAEHQQAQKSTESKANTQTRTIPPKQIPISHPAAIIQRARINPKSLTHADVLQLQRTIGNRAVGKLLTELGLIPSKPKQAQPIQMQQTPEEEEGPLQSKIVETIQRQEVPEEEKTLQGKIIGPIQRQEIPEEEKPLQGKFENKTEQEICPSCSTLPIQRAEENHTGMPDNLKAGVENLSGIDMSDVRVRYNSDKPAEVGALAYTQGANIHVAPGQERHLPHEAWHVVQQAQGRVRPTIKLKDGFPVNNDERLEQEANVMGVKALTKAAQLQSELEEAKLLQSRFEQVQCMGSERGKLKMNKSLAAPTQSGSTIVSNHPNRLDPVSTSYYNHLHILDNQHSPFQLLTMAQIQALSQEKHKEYAQVFGPYYSKILIAAPSVDELNKWEAEIKKLTEKIDMLDKQRRGSEEKLKDLEGNPPLDPNDKKYKTDLEKARKTAAQYFEEHQKALEKRETRAKEMASATCTCSAPMPSNPLSPKSPQGLVSSPSTGISAQTPVPTSPVSVSKTLPPAKTVVPRFHNHGKFIPISRDETKIVKLENISSYIMKNGEHFLHRGPDPGGESYLLELGQDVSGSDWCITVVYNVSDDSIVITHFGPFGSKTTAMIDKQVGLAQRDKQ